MVTLNFARDRISYPSYASQVFQLSRNGTHRLSCGGQVIRVISGQAWLTFNHQDRILEGGDEVRLPASSAKAVISNLGTGHLFYVVE
ncbi:MAG TPA: hypothetical protein VHP83_09990 [Aggregatilineaceae bacterium]|nr:hypothetical protein [Aggregatilineaceae bacterium]